ncbi:hypothetical protein BLA60_01790 [Actinophytocola xinjiangensis]|uniref:2-oxoglutarate-Fe(II)-dependent oxygenase superfamily protein n=1 Tax=Actinophytocola xinjiangensis TaxID=485602 RepID=A0A7Z0WRE9_9PSEU|nr:hypothetical protein [Actinophytocola xinjiangensis]OLF13940.1 hypothetical protein BLA60_01790 [Actinophytocola xinjiangensis]
MRATATVGQRLADLHGSLSPAEQANLKLILGLSAGHLVPERDPRSQRGRTAVSEALELLCPYEVADPRGAQYRGRPDLLTDALLDTLIAEARDVGETAVPFDEHYLGCGGPVADRLATSAELTALVRSVVPGAEPTGIASYLFYRDAGQGIIPHIDTDIFSLNVLLMLDHRTPGDPATSSALYMHYPDGSEERFQLTPGEVVIFLAGTQAHSRTPIVEGERVTILTFGFMPQGAPIGNYRR